MNGQAPTLDRFVVATDGSDSAQRALRLAIALARDTGATLDIVHVVDTRVDYDNDIIRPDVLADALERDGEAIVEAAAAAADAAGLVAETTVAFGTPSEQLLSRATSVDADLILVGRHGSPGLKQALLGSTADAVVRLSSIPVVLCPTDIADPEIR
ncbi:universal stress protein [Haloferacaceae archaeon DSL9]